MDKIVFLCPGQGSQYHGMLKDFKDDLTEINNTIKSITDIDIIELINTDDKNILNSTINTQLLILIHTYIVWQQLPDSCKNKTVAIAGHSLGEFSSLLCSQSLSLENAITLVFNRAKLMDEAVKKNPGMMLAVISGQYEEFKDLIEKLSKEGIIQAANFNSPQQIILTGEKHLIEKIIPLLKERKIKRVLPLKVSGAFHSPLMNDAANKLSQIIDNMDFENPRFPVLSCSTGNILKDKEEIKKQLKKQMTSPVYWDKGIKNIQQQYTPDLYWEIGPGKVLTGLVKKILPEASVKNTDKKEDILEVKGC